MLPIFHVPDDAPHIQEQLGTKFKFWYEDAELGLCLFKETRANTGEDWAEVVAAGICDRIGLPHARYDLAEWEGKRGTISPSILREGEQLILGNELLARNVPDYGERTDRRGGNPFHTLDRILDCLSEYPPPPEGSNLPDDIGTAAECFTGYLLLDALIGNTDRHHENWGCIASVNGADIRLAPSYDHASSMGRELTDERRQEMLTTRDANRTVEAYCNHKRSRSALYRNEAEVNPMTMREAFLLAAQRLAEAGAKWRARLEFVTADAVQAMFALIPPERISEYGVQCAVSIVSYNCRRLLEGGNRD